MIGLFFIIIACCLWAMDTLIRYPMLANGVDATQIVFSEHALLTFFFLPYLFKRRQKIWAASLSHLFYFFMIGALGSAAATLAFTSAFTLVNPSTVILLQKLQPFMAIVLAHFILGESLQKKFILWASVSLIGGVLIAHHTLWQGVLELWSGGGEHLIKSYRGYGLALMAVFGWGLATVFGKKLSLLGYEAKEIMSGRFFFGLLLLLPIILIKDTHFDLAPWTLGKIALLVLLSGLLAMYFYYKGLKKVSARACALAEMFFPFCAVTVNWIFLDQALDPLQLVGAALLLIGSTVIQLKHY